DQRRVFGSAFAEHRCQAGGELALRDRLRIALEDFEAPGEHVAQETVRNVVAVRFGTTLEEPHRLAEHLQPVGQLERETALAEAGLADDRDLPQALLLARDLERFA